MSSSSPPLRLRSPRLTRASEGNPWRRLLIGSKGPLVFVVAGHGDSSHHMDEGDLKAAEVFR
jgi:hypothetical protein